MDAKAKKKIRAWLIPARGECHEVELANTLEAFQKAVGGYIETVHCAGKLVYIVNEEGVILDLPENKHLPAFRGDVLLVGVDGDEFRSLTEREIRVARRFVG